VCDGDLQRDTRRIQCVQHLQRLSVNRYNIHQSEVFDNLCSTNCRGSLDHGHPTRRLARSCYAVRGHVCILCTYYIIQQLQRLDVPFMVICTCAARGLAHSYICGPRRLLRRLCVRRFVQLYGNTSIIDSYCTHTWSDAVATVCLPWQYWTNTLVWFDDVDISAFHSCVVVDLWQSLSEWQLLLSACFGVPLRELRSLN